MFPLSETRAAIAYVRKDTPEGRSPMKKERAALGPLSTNLAPYTDIAAH
jgi:hypothetical protein